MFWRQVWPELFEVCVLSALYLLLIEAVWAVRWVGASGMLFWISPSQHRCTRGQKSPVELLLAGINLQQFWVCLWGIILMALMEVGRWVCYTEQHALPWDPRSYKRSK